MKEPKRDAKASEKKQSFFVADRGISVSLYRGEPASKLHFVPFLAGSPCVVNHLTIEFVNLVI